MDVSDGPLKIDLHAILRKRIGGWKGRLIPGFMITGLEKVVCQDGLNALLEEAYPRRGAAFSAEILRQLGIDVELSGMENIPEEGRFVFASNHPLGGLDGITLISVLAGKYGEEGYADCPVPGGSGVAPPRRREYKRPDVAEGFCGKSH